MPNANDIMTRDDFYNEFDIRLKLSSLKSKYSCKFCGEGLDWVECETYKDHCEECNKMEGKDHAETA